MENILVAGANGTTGKKIINLLKSSQYFNPIAMVRKEEQLQKFKNENIQAILGDLEEDISHTTKNIDKVIFAAGSGGKKVVEVDQEGAKKLIDAAEADGVSKFIMLSSMGADQPDKAEDLQEYLEAKHKADEHLKASKLNYAIVRPGQLTNDEAKGSIEIGKQLDHQGSISRADVAQTLVRSLHDDGPNKMSFEILEGKQLIGKALNNIS